MRGTKRAPTNPASATNIVVVQAAAVARENPQARKPLAPLISAKRVALKRRSSRSVRGCWDIEKLQSPSSNIQRSSKLQLKLPRPGIGCLVVGISLELGCWCLELLPFAFDQLNLVTLRRVNEREHRTGGSRRRAIGVFQAVLGEVFLELRQTVHFECQMRQVGLDLD
jgi:hypothetical protein